MKNTKRIKRVQAVFLCIAMLGSIALPVKAEDMVEKQEDTTIQESIVDAVPEDSKLEDSAPEDTGTKDSILEEQLPKEEANNGSSEDTVVNDNPTVNDGFTSNESTEAEDHNPENEDDDLNGPASRAAVRIPDPVNGLKATAVNQGKIQVNWTASNGAEGYLVYRMTGNEEKMTYRCMTKGTGMVDTTAVQNTFTFYRVYPYIKDATGKMLTGASTTYVFAKAYDGPEPVSNLKAQISNRTDVKLTWNGSAKAKGYLIYRKATNESSFKYLYMVNGTQYIDKTAEGDSYSFYRIYPYFYDGNGKMIAGQSTSYVFAKPISAPEPVSNLKASLYYSSQVQLSWSASKDAEGYLIYRKTGSESSFTYRCMTSQTSVIDTTATAGTYSYYRVYPYFKTGDGKMHAGQSTAYVYSKPIDFPAVKKVSVSNQWNGELRLEWQVDNYWAGNHELDGFLIYKRVGNMGDFKYYKTVSTGYYWNSYVDSNASYIQNNFYKVYPYYTRANGTKQIGPCNSFAYGKAKIAGVSGIEVYEQVDQVRLQWTKSTNTDVQGYDIYRKQGNGSFTYLGTTDSCEYIDKNASKTSINYYRVYPYRMIEGQHVIGISNSYVYGYAKEYSIGQAIADYGWQYIGTPYVWGGNNLSTGVDCSGFTTQVHAQFGVYLPRTSETQEFAGKDIGRDLANAMPGDVICYCYNLSELSCHVAIYVGNGKMINSTTSYDWEGNEIDGIQIGNANYMTIKSIRRFW